ncbi:LamG domain-containing protein [Halorussus gelatinilyticus]|uniref:LamG domain-containing protein n=1 Tax=Halorussus gelatinilyticus TaxID=2937524 RepID=A0A8U0IIY9_9EURY|nr:LamG domain-containing protein [Halorussus gelatinilyticus]UPW00993.1 LamG domain-containing protein [Halorussus gelatinilyticus]
MDERRSTRRLFLQTSGVAAAVGLAGCSGMLGEDDDIQDTDGDGVIDSEDYAPRDSSVQRKEQVGGGDSTETTAETTTEETTEATTEETTTEATTEETTTEETTTEEQTTAEPTEGMVARDRLVSRWPFEVELRDAVGDNDAHAERGEPRFGTFDSRRGVRLDGNVGMMIEEGKNAELSIMSRKSGASSIGGWVYFDRSRGARDANGDGAKHHIFRKDAEYAISAVPASADTVEIRLNIMDQVAGESYHTHKHADDELLVSTNGWHHVFFVVEPGRSLAFYLDGERRFYEGNMPGYSPTATQYWSHETIGSWYGTRSPAWYDLMVGKLSDLRVYDAGLSGRQVARIYANTR